MPYSIVDFASSLRVGDCKILKTPRLIFLCGGIVAKDGAYRSARDYFLRAVRKDQPELAKRIKLAEDVNAWFQKDNRFSDLLELEEYLAQLADATVLFVESPGSIAELGAFAASSVLAPKTFAVLNDWFPPHKNFITDGPVERLKSHGEEAVRYFTWNPSRLGTRATKEEFAEIADELEGLLLGRDADRPQQVALDTSKLSHSLLLIAEFIRIPGVATRSDVAECLRAIGAADALESLDKQLSVLQSVGFIQTKLRSKQTFYTRRSSTQFLRYAFKEDAPLRDLRRIQQAIRRDLDSRRKAVVRLTLRSARRDGASRA